MSNCVKEYTPVEMVKDDLFKFLQRRETLVDAELEKGIQDILCKNQCYEKDYMDKRFKDCLKEIKEENRLMKVQMKVLTRYIEGLEKER